MNTSTTPINSFVHYIYAKRNFPNTDLNPNFKFTGTYPAQNMALQYLHIFNSEISQRIQVWGQPRTRTATEYADQYRFHDRIAGHQRIERGRPQRTPSEAK